MGVGYPNLSPSGFIEFDDPYTGPLLYRNQPSREKTFGPTLSDFMNKYVNQTITDYSFITTLTYLKYFVKHWEKLPKETKQELVALLKKSEGPVSRSLPGESKRGSVPRRVEAFGGTDCCANCTGSTGGYTNKVSLAIVVVVAIVAMGLGYLISFAR